MGILIGLVVLIWLMAGMVRLVLRCAGHLLVASLIVNAVEHLICPRRVWRY